MKKFPAKGQPPSDQDADVRMLKKELARVTEERDILKRVRPLSAIGPRTIVERVLRQGCKVRYAFIDAHSSQHSIRVLCKMLKVHPSGF